ncbi:MAG TPA: alpha-galactosidase, partial [Bryobacteraceae bacterium]|nr:alpha-galactosidase [Bryobacteraceae bacterium]
FGWFALMADELRGGLAGGWEWSGPMTVVFGDRRDPCLIHGGLDATGLSEPLGPGASLTGPMGWYGFFEGGLDEAASLSHKLVEAIAPPMTMKDTPWVGYCTWAASMDKDNPHNEGSHPWFPTEKNVLSQVDAAAELGCAMFLWDYGWFPRVGDWHCDPRRHPNGSDPVVEAVKKAGMKLGLWIGFGNADDDSEVARHHPDWLATYGGKPIPDKFFTRTAASTWNTRTLCLAHRPAREWVKEQLARVIDSFELDWLKHDFDLITVCQDPSHTHTPGDGRIAACAGFYEIMDFVRQRWPNLLCENWMNNSAVPDYGVLQRHHVQLIGDAYQPFRLRQMVHGHLQVFPPDRQHRYIRFEDGSGDFLTMVRSGSIGGPWTILSDPRCMSSASRRTLATEIDRYKKTRHLLTGPTVSRLLGRPHARGWDAIAFWREDLREGILYVFREDHHEAERTIQLPRLANSLKLRALDMDAGRAFSVDGGALRVSLLRRGSCAVFRLSS